MPIGSVLLWRSSLLHAGKPTPLRPGRKVISKRPNTDQRSGWAVAPHLGDSPRYHLYYAYIPRWIRPSFRSALSTAAHPDPSTGAAPTAC